MFSLYLCLTWEKGLTSITVQFLVVKKDCRNCKTILYTTVKERKNENNIKVAPQKKMENTLLKSLNGKKIIIKVTQREKLKIHYKCHSTQMRSKSIQTCRLFVSKNFFLKIRTQAILYLLQK